MVCKEGFIFRSLVFGLVCRVECWGLLVFMSEALYRFRLVNTCSSYIHVCTAYITAGSDRAEYAD